jgi:hypothetical protein
MFTPDYIRKHAPRIGIGSVIESSGQEREELEIFRGSDPSFVIAIKKFAAIKESDRREIVVIFPMVNVRRIEIHSQEE